MMDEWISGWADGGQMVGQIGEWLDGQMGVFFT